MVNFFVPLAENSEQAKRVYDGVKKFVGEEMGASIDKRRFCSLRYKHGGKEYFDKVGGLEERGSEMVICILRDTLRNVYFVCTENRGVARGMPILVGDNEIIAVEEFDNS